MNYKILLLTGIVVASIFFHCQHLLSETRLVQMPNGQWKAAEVIDPNELFCTWEWATPVYISCGTQTIQINQDGESKDILTRGYETKICNLPGKNSICVGNLTCSLRRPGGNVQSVYAIKLTNGAFDAIFPGAINSVACLTNFKHCLSITGMASGSEIARQAARDCLTDGYADKTSNRQNSLIKPQEGHRAPHNDEPRLVPVVDRTSTP